jgi:hypothetical protein
MKQPIQTVLIAAGLGIGMSLTSCVVPYEGTATTTVTTYRPGYTVRTLPGGYRSEVIAGTNYYYHDGHYFRRSGSGYVVVEAPRRSRYYEEYRIYQNRPDGSTHVIRELPRGYTTVTYRGVPYYRYQDRYYRRQGSGYVVVASPF